MQKDNSKTRIVPVVFAAVLVVIDQILKLQAVEALAPGGRREVIRGLFYLSYVENRGAAFGIFQGKTLLLAVLTGVVLLGVLVMMLTGKVKGRLITWSLALVLAGGVGNLIDRIARGYVVDYLDFSALFGFPVFNFADCCVVIGTLLLLCGIMWSDFLVKKQEQADSLAGETGSDETEAQP